MYKGIVFENLNFFICLYITASAYSNSRWILIMYIIFKSYLIITLKLLKSAVNICAAYVYGPHFNVSVTFSFNLSVNIISDFNKNESYILNDEYG